VDGHVGLDMVLGVESPVTDSALEWLLPCVSPLVSLLGRVVPEELATVLTRMSLHDGVHLLVMPPLNSLIKSLTTDGTRLQLKLDVMGIKMLNKVYCHRVCLHFDCLVTDLALGT